MNDFENLVNIIRDTDDPGALRRVAMESIEGTVIVISAIVDSKDKLMAEANVDEMMVYQKAFDTIENRIKYLTAQQIIRHIQAEFGLDSEDSD